MTTEQLRSEWQSETDPAAIAERAYQIAAAMLDVRKKLEEKEQAEAAKAQEDMMRKFGKRPSGFEPEVIPGESKQPQGKPRKEK